MQWLTSFVKLFLLFDISFVLSIAGGNAQVEYMRDYTRSSSFRTLHLIALKFFGQLDRKAK